VALYVTPEEVLASIGGPPQIKPSEGAIRQFVNEAQAIVQGRIGELPTPRNEEVAGIIRDLAAARAIYLMRAAQTNERPRGAAWLMEDATERLKDYDSRTSSAGLQGEVDEEAFVNIQPVDLFTLADANLTIDDDDYEAV